MASSPLSAALSIRRRCHGPRRSRKWLLSVVLLAATTPVHAQRPSTAAGVLVLRNGHLLQGDISRSGDEYVVRQATSVIRLGAAQVEFFARTRREAYEVLRRRHDPPTGDDHIRLAQWCLRNELLDGAAEELDALKQAVPHHRDLRRLEVQLAQAQARGVAVASTAEPLEPPLSRLSPVPLQSAALIDAPATARAEFVRSIQPMLIRSCATAGCHAPGGEETFQLDRLAAVGGGHPALIQANLDQLWRQVDAADYRQSPLVRRASTAHGVAELRSTPLHPHQVEVLEQWLREALELPSPEEAAAAEAAHASDPSGTSAPNALPVAASAPPGSGPAPPAAPAPVAAPDQPVAAASAAPPEGARDRFDPAIFHDQTTR